MDMNWAEILQTLFTVVIIPLLCILSKYGVAYLQTKMDELKNKTDNELEKKYLDMLQDTVADCVLTTTQTYVDSLKNQNAFDAEAQKQAFEMTKTAVLAVLSEDAQEYLQNMLGDFEAYLKVLIESQVQVNKLAK